MTTAPAETLRVGVDVVSVADVAASVRRFGDRYVHRIFTPHEIAACRTACVPAGGDPTYSAESLAARFAAKEAVVKVLRPQRRAPSGVVSKYTGWQEGGARSGSRVWPLRWRLPPESTSSP